MGFEDSKVISGLSDGTCFVAYKPSGNEIIVGGAQADGIRIYELDPTDQDYTCTTVPAHSDSINCIATSVNGTFASGSSDGGVLLYNKNNAHTGAFFRSDMPVRDLCFHPDGKKLAVAGDENVIRVVLCADSSRVVRLQGHKHPVRSLTYEPNGEYIASTDVQGNVLIWNVSADQPVPKCEKVLSQYSYTSQIDSMLQGTISWNPDGSCFAFPGTNNDIRVFQTKVWTSYYTLEGEHTADVITLAWSPNGFYLASSASDNSVVIWNSKTKTAICTEVTVVPVTGIAWHPTENEITLTDTNGSVRIWKDPVPKDNSNYPHPALRRSKSNLKVQFKLEPSSKSNNSSSSAKSAPTRPHIPAKEAKRVRDMDEDMDEDVEMDDGEDVGDFVIDDDGAGYVETPEVAEEMARQRSGAIANGSGSVGGLAQRQKQMESAFEPPIPFQPGETPFHVLDSDGPYELKQGERRYLAFNLVGVISTIFEKDHSIINVEFHDQSEHRNFHFTDVYNFSLAAISPAGTVYAAEGKEAVKKAKKASSKDDLKDTKEDELESEAINSVLYFRPNSSANQKDWTHHMLPGEDVITVAINRVSVIATTSLGYVRVFTLSGVQRFIFSLENVVSITAMTDLAMIVYTTGPAYNRQQNLSYLLFNTDTNEVLQKDALHMTTESDLIWIGFSETNQAATYDSAGILRVLKHQRRPYQGLWTPVFDGKAYAKSQQRNERHWPVGVLRDRLMCIVLRGNNTHPFFPRPLIKDIPLQLPLLDMSNEVGKLEETLLRVETCNLHEKDEAEATEAEEEYASAFSEADIQMDIALLKLINLACKSEKVSKALDLTYILHRPLSVDKAIKIAIHHRYTKLAEKITKVKQLKFMDDGLPTPSTLADSFAAMPAIHSSTQPTLGGDLSMVKKPVDDDEDSNGGATKRSMPPNESNNNGSASNGGATKRSIPPNESNNNGSASKKSRPFQFSNR